MMKIRIPFNEWSKKRLVHAKIATSRYKRYGKKGDTFSVGDYDYRIDFVVKLPLWFITYYLYRTEGAESPEEFQKVWANIHPKKGWLPEDEVWYHCFNEVID